MRKNPFLSKQLSSNEEAEEIQTEALRRQTHRNLTFQEGERRWVLMSYDAPTAQQMQTHTSPTFQGDDKERQQAVVS